MHDKHQIIEEPCEVKVSRTVLKTSEAGDSLAEFNTVTSEGEKTSGKEITQVRDKYTRVTASVEKKASNGTRSSRRRCRQLLKRLGGREQKFQTLVNHTISYRHVQYAKATGQAIALEDLTGIRERTNELPRSKTERRRSNSWAFYQLRQFITYKAVKFGVNPILVVLRYTSLTCHHCWHIHPNRGESYRNGKSFRCGHCGWHGDADLNGAKNIAAIGHLLAVPGGSGLACSLSDRVLGLLKSPRSASATWGRLNACPIRIIHVSE